VNRTLQDRLVKELTSAGIRTLERANRYIEASFLPAYNEEFSRAPAHPDSGFAPLGSADLGAIFCHEEDRTVQRDNTVTLEGLRLQIAKQPGRVTCAGLSVRVRRHLDGTHTITWGARAEDLRTWLGESGEFTLPDLDHPQDIGSLPDLPWVA
jgi:hypothetical protein